MFRKYRLEPLTAAHSPIEFEWDPVAGEVRGRDADQVRQLAMEAKQRGDVVGHPYPTVHRISDPFRRPEEVAVIVGNSWRLSSDLEAAYPRRPVEPPDPLDDPDLYVPPIIY